MPGQAPEPDSDSDLPPGGLVGRAAEVAAIIRMLGGTRLATVTGLPGVGKTAVSLKAASAIAWNFTDGALTVRLDTLRDEALLPHTIAAALELDDRFAGSRLDVLIEGLCDRRMLVVLDTCEHVLGASAGLASALLAACPGVRILATSRQPLRVPGESVMSARPLRPGDAVTLFTQRAAQTRGRLTVEHRAVVESICALLDRLPLAIELAVRQLAGMEPLSAALAELASGLEAGDELPGRAGGSADRHRTLRAAIGWSHGLCTPAERLLWARLSVFSGPFLPRHAQDVCTTSQLPDEAVAACLAMLAERSILLWDEPAGFRLPATIRAYGRTMLRRLGQDQEFTERYRRWQKVRHARANGDAG
jgi:predicted ATPase